MIAFLQFVLGCGQLSAPGGRGKAAMARPRASGDPERKSWIPAYAGMSGEAVFRRYCFGSPVSAMIFSQRFNSCATNAENSAADIVPISAPSAS